MKARPSGTRWWTCALAGLFAGLSIGPGAVAAPPTEQGGLGLSDGKFWGDSTDVDERAADLFLQSDFVGLFLDGPKRMRFREHSDLPLIGVRAASNQESFAMSLQRRAVLVSTWLEGDQTYAALAFRQPDEPSKSRPRRPSKAVPEGHGADAFRIVLNKCIPEVASQTGQWHTTLLLFDRKSNRVATGVESDPREARAANGSEAAKHPRAYPARISPPVDEADHPYRARPDSPALPGESTIVLGSAGKVDKAPGRAWVLRGSYRLPALARDVVRPLPGLGFPAERKAREAGWEDVGDPAAVAVLPVTIILTGDEDATPILVPLHVPIYQPIERIKGEQLVRGHFAVDLLALVGDKLRPQTYAVWAVSRQQVSEPIVVRVARP